MNKYIKNIIIITLMLVSVLANGQKTILLMGGIAHLGNGDKIDNSVISIKEGKIDLVADLSKIRIDPDAFDTIYKIYGKHIYPGFILTNTKLGITEIDQVRATHDFREVGDFNPNISSQIAFNVQSKIIETVRTNGVLITQATPQGGVISGQSSVMYLSGWNWEDATCKANDGVHLRWPSSYYNTGWWAEQGKIERNKNHEKKVNEIIDFLEKSFSYFKSNNPVDLKMESMKGIFNGTKNLYLHANYANDIIDGIDICKKFNIKKIVLIGGEDAHKVINHLKKNNIDVILNRVHRLPKNEDSPLDQPYTQASILNNNNIKFAFSYAGGMEAMGSRNLPFTAGTAVAYGLDYENTIKSLTLNPAEILGIDKTLGSIEQGKEATFFISEGDALNITTNDVRYIFINGEEISIENHQSRLYEKYKNR
jgi:imidazolonepropionase-like amidohydrolase